MLVKERLTGAVILVGLIVVVVPELLNGPFRPAARVHGAALPAEEPPLRSYTINLADEPRGGSGALDMHPAAASPPAPAAESAGSTRGAQSTPPAPRTSAPPAAAPPAASHTSAAPPASAGAPAASGSGYVVQLGSFASRSNAERLARQVHGQGFAVSVSRGAAGRRLYRVQVGPARERAAAEQLAAKLRAQGHAGTVVAK
jgi:cell division septation protein DedD